MDWNIFWQLTSSISDYFYDPLVFWGVPFALAIGWEILNRRTNRGTDHDF